MRYLALLLLAACTDFAPIPEVGCGNSVVESTEDCDTIAPEGLTCAAPGAINACRFVCDPAAPACPPAWGCGADGVCRVASGGLEAPVATRFAALSLATGDLDGDRAGDLVGLLPNRASVLYGGSGVLFGDESSVAFGLASGDPAVGDLDRDGFDDLVVPTFLGLYVARGGPAPPLSPTAFAPLSIPATTRIRFTPLDGDVGAFTYPGDEVLAVVDGAVLFFDDEPALATITPLPDKSPGVRWDAADLTGRIPKYKRGPGFPATFVLAFAGATSVYVYSVTAVDVGGGVFLPKPVLAQGVSLPLGYVVAAQGAQFLDYDGDTLPDILVAVQAASGGPTKVALSRSVPPFETPAGLLEGFRAITQPGVGGVICGDSAYPLAVTVQAGRFVVVGSNAVCRLDPCGPAPCYDGLVASVLAFNASGAPWTEAMIVDVNRDGFDDIAATSGLFSVVDFFITEGGRYNPFFVATFDPATSLRHGDFDGDFVEDVAIVERGELSGRGSSLSILYGKSQGAPESPVSIGSFAPVVALEPGSIVKNPLFQNDAIDDLFVQFEGDGEKGLTVLFGTSQRTLLAPYTLLASGTAGEQVPLAVVSAQLDGDGIPDLFATSAERGYFLRGTGEGDFDKVVDQPFMDGAGNRARCTVWTAGRLREGEPEVIVGVDRASAGRFCNGLGDTAGVSSVLVVRPSDAGIIATATALPPSIGDPVAIDLADLDRNGFADLVISFRGATSPIRVVWNDGDGLNVAGEAAAPAFPTPGTPFSFSAGNLDDDPLLELAVLADTGVWILDVDPMTRALAWRPQAALPVEADPFSDGDVRLVDLDGDGVLDLAVSQAITLIARRSIPVR